MIFYAILVAKLAAALSISTGLVTAVKYFNNYDPKAKFKKGGVKNDSNDLDYLREKVRYRD